MLSLPTGIFLLKVFYSHCVKDIKDSHPFTVLLICFWVYMWSVFLINGIQLGLACFIQSESLYLFIGLFTLTFNVIIDMAEFKSTSFLFLLYLSYVLFFFFSSPFLFVFTIIWSIFNMHLISSIVMTKQDESV